MQINKIIVVLYPILIINREKFQKKNSIFVDRFKCWFYHFSNRLSWRTWKIAFFHLHHRLHTKVFTPRGTRTPTQIALKESFLTVRVDFASVHTKTDTDTDKDCFIVFWSSNLKKPLFFFRSLQMLILSCFLSVRNEELERLLFFHLHHGLQNDRRQSSRIKKMIRDGVRACVGDDDRGWHPGWVSVLVWIEL